MFRTSTFLLGLAIVAANFGCGSSSSSSTTSNSNTNSAVVANKEVRLDPANMPAGISANPVQPSANMPPGISMNAVNIPIGNKKIPGIPTQEELNKKPNPGKTPPIPGIPDEATIRKQMGLPANPNLPPANASTNSVPMMKGKRPLGGKMQ